jgi:hypothetical protein
LQASLWARRILRRSPPSCRIGFHRQRRRNSNCPSSQGPTSTKRNLVRSLHKTRVHDNLPFRENIRGVPQNFAVAHPLRAQRSGTDSVFIPILVLRIDAARLSDNGAYKLSKPARCSGQYGGRLIREIQRTLNTIVDTFIKEERKPRPQRTTDTWRSSFTSSSLTQPIAWHPYSTT